jgi:hypothetical protein
MPLAPYFEYLAFPSLIFYPNKQARREREIFMSKDEALISFGNPDSDSQEEEEGKKARSFIEMKIKKLDRLRLGKRDHTANETKRKSVFCVCV